MPATKTSPIEIMPPYNYINFLPKRPYQYDNAAAVVAVADSYFAIVTVGHVVKNGTNRDLNVQLSWNGIERRNEL